MKSMPTRAVTSSSDARLSYYRGGHWSIQIRAEAEVIRRYDGASHSDVKDADGIGRDARIAFAAAVCLGICNLHRRSGGAESVFHGTPCQPANLQGGVQLSH